TRYLNRLKQDDDVCAEALQRAQILLFHRLSPLLQQTERGTFRAVALTSSEVLALLERLGSDRTKLKESVLIGCSEQDQVQFCLDVGKNSAFPPAGSGELDPVAVEEACDGAFVDLKKGLFVLRTSEAPLLAKAQALLRWHHTSRFCAATGQPTCRNQAGTQRVSSSGSVLLPSAQMSPVAIVLVSDGQRCLLARQPAFPPGMYSALAGFCELGESLEETASREVAEEVGLEVHSVSYSCSQHWPFPHSSFMLGCHALVSPAHTQLHVDQAELEDARWFSLQDVTSALQVRGLPQRGHAPPLWLPPKQAIANRLITEWAEHQRGSQKGG
uniref:NAD(+) diphosphatase n=1 Tax=Tetraodon nigroviridis TaxID=99883 RepID=H3DMG7_TETNG